MRIRIALIIVIGILITTSQFASPKNKRQKLSAPETQITTNFFTKITIGVIATDTAHSSGVSWVDFDNDGHLDLYVANTVDDNIPENNYLYRNNGDGTFIKITNDPIVSDNSETYGNSWGDYDNDGYLDLFVPSEEYVVNNFLFHNNGTGTFSQILAGDIVDDGGGSRAGIWGDYNNDGYIDLFVANFARSRNFLYRNKGDGTFMQIQQGAVVSDSGNSRGCAWSDYDNDGDLDLYVANQGATSPYHTMNYLYHNNGNGDFTKIISGSIVEDKEYSFGCSWGDYDNDGDPDLFVANFGDPNFLYQNNGDGFFTKIESGVIVEEYGFSSGSIWGDYDNDGDLDLFVANGSPLFPQRNSLYQNEGPPDYNFTKIDGDPVVEDSSTSSGCGWGDYDGDGFLDLFVANDPPDNNFLFKNNGNTNNWIKFICTGSTSNRSAIGTKVRIKATINGTPIWQLREITSQSGYASQSSIDPHFGLGDASIVDSVIIQWPGGKVQYFTNILPGQSFPVQEPPDISVLSEPAMNVIPTAARFRGKVNTLDADIFFEWGLDTTYGNIVEAIVNYSQPSPDISVSANIFDLTPNITYHYRLVAVSNGYTVAGDDVSFTTTVNQGIFSRLTNIGIGRDRAKSRGGSWIDYDNDGDLDLFVVNQDHEDFFYRNDGSYFTRLTQADVGAVIEENGHSAGHSWTDYDNDGDLDVYIVKFGYNKFYENNLIPSNIPNFTQLTSGPLVAENEYSSSCSWADYNNDGRLDLFIANYGDENSMYLDNYLFRNDGGRTFTEMTVAQVGSIVSDGGHSVGSAWCDYDLDGDMDLFVANFENEHNFLYRNELMETGQATFTLLSGSVVYLDGGNSRGGSWGDYDNDGYPDLFVTNEDDTTNFLYQNNGNGTFTKIVSGEPVDDAGDGNGSAWGDFDNDGDLDLFVANYIGSGENNFLYQNNGGIFSKILTGSIATDFVRSGGACWGDYDSDGKLDLFVAAEDSSEHNLVYQNNGSSSNNWIGFKLIGTLSNRSAIGAKVKVKAIIDGLPRWQHREITSQSGKFSQNSLYAHFGLKNTNAVDSVIIEWPGEEIQILIDPAVNTLHEIIEPSHLSLQQDSLALVALYNNTSGPNWTNNNHWLTGPVDEWFGITVSGGRVTSIDLAVNNLNGPIPAEIGNLTALKFLDLGPNNLTGSIPEEIGSLMQLEFLDLNSNNLDGSIPGSIGNWENITYLNLSVNNLTGTIPTAIYNLSTLETLDLGPNENLGGIIAPAIGNLTQLETLDFESMAITGKIPEEIGALQNLRMLYLGTNDIGDTIPNSLYNLMNLNILDLGPNHLSGKISPLIGNLKNLVVLDLCNNELTGSIPPQIDSLDNLITLELCNNHLSGSIPSGLYYLNNLEFLDLGPNMLSGVIAPQIENLSNLTYLDMEYNDLEGIIPSNLSDINSLTIINLSHNTFSGLPNLQSINALDSLAVDYNRFTFEDIENNVGISKFIYSPQDSIGIGFDTTMFTGNDLTLSTNVGGTNNQYQWFKNGNIIPGADSSVYTLYNATTMVSGKYRCEVTNSIATELTLYSRVIKVTVVDTNTIFTRITSGAIVSGEDDSYGSSWIDFDLDGDLDLFVTNDAGEKNALYRNKLIQSGVSSFEKTIGVINFPTGGNYRCFSWADYDNDGDPDLFVGNEDGNSVLCRNNIIPTGDTLFTVFSSGLIPEDGAGAIGCSWGDYDNDGNIDLFITKNPNVLFKNNGPPDHSFSRITNLQIVLDGGDSQNPCWGDYDNDGDLDLFIPKYYNQHNALFQNNLIPTGDTSFTKINTAPFNTDEGYSVSANWADFNNDGYLDLFVENGGANPENNFLYRNNGPASGFSFTKMSGNIVAEAQVTRGSSWGDYDNDGDLDLLVANSNNISTYNNNLFLNTGYPDYDFVPVADEAIVSDGGHSTGSTNGDYDNDGDLDLYIANDGQNNFLYQKNDNSNHWLKLSLRSVISNGSAIGTRVKIKSTINGSQTWQKREVAAQTGNYSQNSMAVHFGLGDATTIDSLKIEWPSGIQWDTTNVSVDQFLPIYEPAFAPIVIADSASNIAFTAATLNGTVNPKGLHTTVIFEWGADTNYGNILPTVPDSIDGTNLIAVSGNLSDLTPNTLYHYRLVANNPVGTTRSDGRTFTTLAYDQSFTQVTTGSIVTDGGRSAGASWGDYNNDGWLDVYVSNGGSEANYLYRNTGSGSFTRINSGAVVTDQGCTHSSSWGDYDNDGNLDLFVTNCSGNNFLYHNDGAPDYTFTRITNDITVMDGGTSRGCSWGDFNNDGFLDLFVTNDSIAEANDLYLNNGDATFTKITSGGAYPMTVDVAVSIGSTWGDYDNDGDQDLFVANLNTSNFLYRNNGAPDFTFTRITTGNIVADGNASKSGNWIDYNNDGYLDLFVVNYNENSVLYQNNGNNTFTPKTFAGTAFSQSSNWADFDNDGDQDFVVVNEDTTEANFFYRNDGPPDYNFTAINSGIVANIPAASWGCSWADIENDGDLDLFVTNTNGQPNHLFRNNGNNNSRINIKLIGDASNRSAIGARVRIKSLMNGTPVWQAAEVSGQSGWNSQNSLNVEFGLGSTNIIDSIVVDWPSKLKTILTDVTANQFLNVIEPPAYPSQRTLNTQTDFPAAKPLNEYASTDYRIVGLPGMADFSTVGLISGNYTKDWVIYRDTGAKSDDPTANIDEYLLPFDSTDNNFVFSEGRAFWLLHKGPWKIEDIIVPTVPLNEDLEAEIVLHPGWNLITNPFDTTIPWATIQALYGNQIQDIHTYINGFSTADNFVPYVGYYFYNGGAETLETINIPYTLTYMPASALNSENPYLWRVRVQLNSGKFIDHTASFGVSKLAEKGIDYLDSYKPRSLSKSPEASFTIQNHKGIHKVFASDIRPEYVDLEIWELTVHAQPGMVASMIFPNVGKIPPDQEIRLINEAGFSTIDLKSDSTYRFTPLNYMTKFLIVVGTAAAIDAKLQQYLPREFALGYNYPNPFNPSTTIPVTIPESSGLSLIIYNILGQHVKTIHTGHLEPGRYWFEWNGRDENQAEVASGIYFCRLKIENGPELFRKMILLK